MEKKKKGKPVTKKQMIGLGVLCGVMVLLLIACFVMFIKVGMFPVVLIVLVGVVMALLAGIICTLMFATSKRRFGKARVVAIVMAVITIISCVVGIFFMSQILGIFGSVLKGGDISKADLDEPFVVYISGSDTRSDELDSSTTSRSDVNILAFVNPTTHEVLLLNTPRDYYVENPALGYKMDKLTHCGLSGVENSMAALANLYGEEVDYYGRINFTGFETLIDAIGGIDVYSDVAFTTESTSNVRIVVGENHLDGYSALAFARERYALSDGDFGRGENQMKVIKAVANKLMSSDTLIKNYSSIMSSLSGMFETDVPQKLITNAVKEQLSDSPEWNIQSYSVTGTVGTASTATEPGTQLSVVFQDSASIAEAQELISQVMNGD